MIAETYLPNSHGICSIIPNLYKTALQQHKYSVMAPGSETYETTTNFRPALNYDEM
jgi:hypothetical protein